VVVDSMYGSLLPAPPSLQVKIRQRWPSAVVIRESERGTEQRRNRRIPFDKHVALWRCDGAGRVRRFPGIGLNISSGGVRVLCSRRLAVDEELGVQLRSDRGVLIARVIWVKPSSDGCVAGISFRGDVLESPRVLATEARAS